MLANFHTHSTFSDGKDEPEEIIKYAIECGFDALGFSDHAFMDHDRRYCMKDTNGYIAEIQRLKEKYANKIQIYLGTEEDVSHLANRKDFEYIISSLHFIYFQGKYYPLDSNYEYYTTCLNLFDGNEIALADAYYNTFVECLIKRKPNIIGHFDLVTKFDELHQDRFLHNEKYWLLAENYLKKALSIGSIFEVNTGLITRGFRSSPCPHERLLKIIAKEGGKVTLSSDAHEAKHLSSGFVQAKQILREVGFDGSYVLFNGQWEKVSL